jgi:hypothetical protein
VFVLDVVILERHLYLIIKYYGMIDKTAKTKQRSQRKEPEQEVLVRLKDQSNDRMSKLITLYKAVIKGVNGGPSPGIGVGEKFNLTAPMPASIPEAAQQAAQEAASLADFVRQIDQEQDNYSAGKTEKMQQRLQQMHSRMQEMQSLQEQVQQVQQEQVQSAVEYTLQKEASNRLSRLWSHLTPFSWGEKGRGHRLSMLRSLARINHNLKDIEDAVLGGDPKILNAVYLAKQLWDDADTTFFKEFGNQLSSMTNIAEEEVSNIGIKLKNIQDELQKIKDMPKDDGLQNKTRTGPVQMPQSSNKPISDEGVAEPIQPNNTTTKEESSTLTLDEIQKIVEEALKQQQEIEKRLRSDYERMKIPKRNVPVGNDEPTTMDSPDDEMVENDEKIPDPKDDEIIDNSEIEKEDDKEENLIEENIIPEEQDKLKDPEVVSEKPKVKDLIPNEKKKRRRIVQPKHFTTGNCKTKRNCTGSCTDAYRIFWLFVG